MARLKDKEGKEAECERCGNQEFNVYEGHMLPYCSKCGYRYAPKREW